MSINISLFELGGFANSSLLTDFGITLFATLIGVFLAFLIEAWRIKNSEREQVRNLLMALRHEIVENQESLNQMNTHPTHIKATVHTRNWPLSLEIMKMILTETLIYKHCKPTAAKDIWDALQKLRRISRSQSTDGTSQTRDVLIALDSLKNILEQLDEKLKTV